MSIMTVGTGASLIRGHYHEKVLAMQPIAYWPLCESAGTVARCLTNPAMNGTYSSDVATWPVGPGIGDGNTAPQHDGANDYVGIGTAALVAAFNGNEGTVHGWSQVAGAGTWADGVSRWAIDLRVDANNQIYMLKRNVANGLNYVYDAGGVVETLNTSETTLGWWPWAITWSASADEVKFYQNRVQTGATATVLGVWVGVLAAGSTVIGARFTTPTDVWHGGQAHWSIFNRALRPAEIAALGTI